MSMPLVKYIPFQTEKSSAVSEANILCLGNFDGVHFAHRMLMHRATELRRKKFPNARCGVFCFERPSGDFLSPNPPPHLTTLSQKLQYFADEGMDLAFVADFNPLRELSPEEFIKNILIGQCACTAVVCGYNYRFGKGGVGTYQLLQEMLGADNVIVVDPIYMREKPVSSTRIRELLLQGNVKEANELLVVPFSITAPVVHGKGLGKHLGAPTFNQIPDKGTLIPCRGVYLTKSQIDGIPYWGLTNVGTHPTVDKDAPLNLETHLIDFNEDLYQKEITVTFLDYIRPELCFRNTEELQKQIQQDIQAAKERL